MRHHVFERLLLEHGTNRYFVGLFGQMRIVWKWKFPPIPAIVNLANADFSRRKPQTIRDIFCMFYIDAYK